MRNNHLTLLVDYPSLAESTAVRGAVEPTSVAAESDFLFRAQNAASVSISLTRWLKDLSIAN